MTLWKTTLAAGPAGSDLRWPPPPLPAAHCGSMRLRSANSTRPRRRTNADSILNVQSVYDTLVLPVQGGPGHAPHLAESWDSDGNSFTFKLRSDVNFQSGNPLTAEDVVFSVERMKALGAGPVLSPWSG